MATFHSIFSFNSRSFQVDQQEFWATLEEDSKCMQEIIPNLYLGNERSAGKVLGKPDCVKDSILEIKNNLKEKNITHILCLTSEGNKYFSDQDFYYKIMKINDVADQKIKFEEAIQFIDDALKEGEGILVHCAAGQSRSSTVVIAYLIDKCKCSYEHVLKFVQSKRACALPNDGFEKLLIDFSNQ